MRIGVWIAAALLVSPSCKSEENKGDQPETPAKRAPDAATRAASKAAADAGPQLLAKPLARRLHVDRAEASSFLWNDWNRFQENYHPLYLVDDDPRTAWVEGADGPGVGEWIRLHVTPIEAATAVAVKLRDGYQKSRSLFKKNARVKTLVVALEPSGVEKRFELEDAMKWQTLELVQPEGKLEAIVLRIAAVYRGTKYADLCLSDAQIEVTSRTPDNPAFEKAKLERVKAWKASRLEAARLFASAEAKKLPIGGSYKVTGKREIARPRAASGAMAEALTLLEAAPGALGGKDELFARAGDALRGEFAGWVGVSVAMKKARDVPSIDGLYVPDTWEIAGGSMPREDSYEVPLPGKLEFLTSSRLSAFESARTVPIAEALEARPAACKREDEGPVYFYYRSPEGGKGESGVLRQLLVVQCGQVAERDGYYGYASFQLLEYDGSGKLVASVGPRGITTYDWGAGGKIAGGARLRATYRDTLIADKLVARK